MNNLAALTVLVRFNDGCS